MKKILSLMLIITLVLVSFVSCATPSSDDSPSKDDAKDTKATTLSPSNPAPDTGISSTDPNTAASVSFGLVNGQWQTISKFEYNKNGQLLAITAINPFTLAPMCYETIKNDRVFIYGEDEKLEKVWMSYGYHFDVSYSADGCSAEASATKDGETLTLKLTFKGNVIVKEEYRSSDDMWMIFEYDDTGRIVSETRSTGFSVYHSYENGSANIQIKRNGNDSDSYRFVCDQNGKLMNIYSGSSSDPFTTYSYNDKGLCVKCEYGNETYNMSYDDSGRVISAEQTDAHTLKKESLEYDENGNILKYTRHYKETEGYFTNTKQICIYTYDENGLIKEAILEHIELDASDNETAKRSETLK